MVCLHECVVLVESPPCRRLCGGTVGASQEARGCSGAAVYLCLVGCFCVFWLTTQNSAIAAAHADAQHAASDGARARAYIRRARSTRSSNMRTRSACALSTREPDRAVRSSSAPPVLVQRRHMLRSVQAQPMHPHTQDTPTRGRVQALGTGAPQAAGGATPPRAADTSGTPGAPPVRLQRHLVIDALNYLTFFIPVLEPAFRGRPPWSLHAEMQRRVVFFLQACALAHWVPHFVIDSGQQSDEVRAKWRMRREREVACGFRPMPYNAGACGARMRRACCRGAMPADAPRHGQCLCACRRAQTRAAFVRMRMRADTSSVCAHADARLAAALPRCDAR